MFAVTPQSGEEIPRVGNHAEIRKPRSMYASGKIGRTPGDAPTRRQETSGSRKMEGQSMKEKGRKITDDARRYMAVVRLVLRQVTSTQLASPSLVHPEMSMMELVIRIEMR